MGGMKLQFSDPESFMYFYEGLRSLQLFRDSNNPTDLSEAAEALEAGSRLYPDDALSTYYLGVVKNFQAQIGQNATQNQARAIEIFGRLKEETTLGDLHACARAAVETLQREPEEGSQPSVRAGAANGEPAQKAGSGERVFERLRNLARSLTPRRPEDSAYSLQQKIARLNARTRRVLDDNGDPTKVRPESEKQRLSSELEKLQKELGATRINEAARRDMAADICNTAGLVNLAFKEFDKAEVQFRKALTEKPDWIVAKRNLADALDAQVPSLPTQRAQEQQKKADEARWLRLEIEAYKKQWQQPANHDLDAPTASTPVG